MTAFSLMSILGFCPYAVRVDFNKVLEILFAHKIPKPNFVSHLKISQEQFRKKTIVQGVLGLHEFWARNKFVQAKFVLVKLCTSTFSKLRASEILSTCYPRNGVYLKIRASEIRTSEIRASQGPPVVDTNFANPQKL